ncbi:MAG: PQQ-binding-like beta-propeller repeat protein [bacterium]
MRRFFLFLFFLNQLLALQFIHITDTHIGTASGNKNLAAFVQLMQNFPQRPDFIIHTGDITEFGSEEEFQAYSRLISSLNIPIYHTLGNHDVRWNGAGWLIGERYLANYKRNYVFTKEGILFIALDSSFPFSQYGLIDPTQLKWLRETLSKIPPQQPIIIFSHHPPLPSRNFLIGEEALFEILRPYNVVLFLTGHGHSNLTWQREGINFLMTKGLMDENTNFRLIKIENNEIEISTIDLAGKEKENNKTRFPLRRTFTQINENPKNNKFSPIKKLSSSVQADLLSYNDLIFACDWDGEVVAIKGEGQDEIWRIKCDSPIISSPAIDDGKLFVPFLNGYIRCYDCLTGKLLWETNLPQPITGHLLVEKGKVFVPAYRRIFALNERGEILWQRELDGTLEARPLVRGNILYVGAWDKKLYAINIESGDVIWQRETARSRYFSPATSSPIFWNNLLIITQPYDSSTRRGGLLALDEKGNTIWQIGGNFGYSTPVVKDDKLFIASMEGKLICVSTEGKILWSTNLSSPCFNSRPIIEKNRLYLVSFNDILYSVDINDGKIMNKKVLSTDSCCVSTPTILKEKLFIADMMGNIYAVPLSEPSSNN